MSRPALILIGAVAVGIAVPARAEATTRCSFSTVVGVNFGAYSVFSPSPLDSTGSITFLCDGVGPVDFMVIDLSPGSAGTFASRALSGMGGGGQLAYNLYLDAARTVVWGDGSSGTGRYGPIAPASNTSVTIPIYARIPARQNVAVGAYADAIIVTVNF